MRDTQTGKSNRRFASQRNCGNRFALAAELFRSVAVVTDADVGEENVFDGDGVNDVHGRKLLYSLRCKALPSYRLRDGKDHRERESRECDSLAPDGADRSAARGWDYAGKQMAPGSCVLFLFF